ncbi:MAG: hypothetical protein WC714_29210 [Candidatus Obscuribacterales bacterium]|jgi:hypothetical protein
MELDHEIFAEGKWNGMEFTADDLQNIADTFNVLGENMKVCLKMGHNKEQRMTDGQPALGWVSKVWVAGEKLMAHYTDLPQIVYDAIKKKLYRHVSIELDIDVSHKGNKYPYVLTGVALLGADIPAVNTLKDLNHYMSRDATFSVGRHAVFSAIAGNQTKGDSKMDKIQELTEQVADLTIKLAAFTAEAAKSSAEKTALEAEVAKFKADAKVAAETAIKTRIDAKRKEVTEILEDGVKAEAITPAQRTQYTKLLRIEDDAALDALDITDVKALVPAGKKFSRQQAKQGGDDKGDLRPDQQVAKEIAEVQATNATLSFAAAQKIVFDRNPELASAYMHANDKEQ